MAEQISDLPLTPEIIRKPNGGNPRRNSVGKASSSNNGEKVLPHYLRASTGSCHDFCKYGRKHAFEAKERRSIPKRTTKAPSEDQSLKQITILSHQREKKTSVIKSKPSPVSKPRFSDVPEVIKREISSKPQDPQKVSNSDGEISVAGQVKKTSAVKLRSSLHSKSRLSESPKMKRQEVSSSSDKNVVSSRQASSSKAKATNEAVKNVVSRKPKPMAQKSLSSPDTSWLSRRLSGGGGSSDIKTAKRAGPSKLAVKNIVSSPRTSLAAKPSLRRVASLNARKHLKVASSLKNQGKIKKAETKQSKGGVKRDNKDLVQEKTVYVVQMETENKSLAIDENECRTVELSPVSPSSLAEKSLPSSPSSLLDEENEDQEKFEYTETETEDDNESEYEETKGKEIVESEHQGRPRKNMVVRYDEKDNEAVKLCFRRGKVIDAQTENNYPKRLRFRRGRLVGENQIPKGVEKRRFKKREVESEQNDEKPDPEKVVLRHQDVEGKKEAQILFNNVIEQTASKLVETRKSKVKALVGAFETVISLQESKPSANSAS